MAEKEKFSDSSTDYTVEDNDDNKQLGSKAWYIATSYSTHEASVKDNLEKRKETFGLQDLIFRIVVAEQEVPTYKTDELTGEKVATGKTKKVNLYPGYIFIEMIMTNHAWYVIRNTPGVTGFVGSSGKGTKPFPVPREQIEPVLKRMGIVDSSMYDRYSVGNRIRVIHGTVEGTEGELLSINKETGTVVIKVTFFGNSSVIEVGFDEIERI